MMFAPQTRPAPKPTVSTASPSVCVLMKLLRALTIEIAQPGGFISADQIARLAGVPARVHGEHGWDVSDPGGTRRKFQWLRRAYSPFVNRYVALSGHIESYLVERVGISPARVARICNGVDARRFHPRLSAQARSLAGLPEGFATPGTVIVGTVGRQQAVKDPLALVRAFALARTHGEVGGRLRLLLAGDGPLRATLEAEIRSSGLEDAVWLAGERADVPAVMRALDVFALPSRAEGISNTVLEAMASGLPVVEDPDAPVFMRPDGDPAVHIKRFLELGFDAGFGPGTKPSEVASLIVEHVHKAK